MQGIDAIAIAAKPAKRCALEKTFDEGPGLQRAADSRPSPFFCTNLTSSEAGAALHILGTVRILRIEVLPRGLISLVHRNENWGLARSLIF